MKRQTYGAVNRPERQINSFVEESGSGSSAPTISSSAFSVTDSQSPTVFVGIIPTILEDNYEKDPFDVLAVQKDGRVRRLSSDLETQRWSIRHSEIAKNGSTHEVHACFLVEFEDAKKSLFKRRQDLAALALGNLTDSGVDEPSILALVSHPSNAKRITPKDVKVQMFSVPANASASGLTLDESQRMRHLLTVDLPEVEGQEIFESRGLRWDFHSGSASLNLSFDKGFVSFDLSQYSPTVSSQFILQDEQFSSIMRISPQSVIGAGRSLVALYDTQYQSVQRSIPVDDIPSRGSSEETVFVGYFAKLGIAVASKGNTLFAFDLAPSTTAFGSSLKRPRDGLLIDAIGRGIGSSGQCDPSKKLCTDNRASLNFGSAEEVEKWNQLTNALEESVKSKDAARFDSAVQAYFGSDTLPTSEPVHPELPVFLLTKIFTLKESENRDKVSASSPSQLAVQIWPKVTCDWLIRLGHLCMSNVDIAVRRSFKPRILPSLPTGSLSQALIDSDQSLRRITQVLQGPVLVNSDELAYTLRTFLSMARSCAGTLEETAKALTNSDQAETNTNTQLISPHPRASLSSIFRGLNTTLRKLHTQPVPSITKSLRSALSKPELISMIHHLRLSLATGGYTARFTENPPTPITPDQIKPYLSLDTITDLLAASIDAIGPSGWISATSTDLGPELDLIADMKSEIAAALAGVEEATYLKGILQEYIRFADSMTSSDTRMAGKSTAETPTPLVRHEKLNGADLMVFTAADGEDGAGLDGEASGKMLPLSLKAPSADVSKTKVKKSTGEVRSRSSREIGHLRRKQAGKYSFERLIV